MQTPDIASLTSQVLWGAFILSVIFGAIAQRTHFCTMGAVSDVVNFGDWSRMRMWGLAVGVAMIGYAALAASGQIQPAKALYASDRLVWLSAIVGGAMFGFGMVLASGCGSKTLVRIGAGSLKGVVVFVVLGVAAYATLRGITAVARVATVDKVFIAVAAPGDLGSVAAGMFGVARPVMAGVIALLLGGGLIIWSLRDAQGRSGTNLLAGLGIGAVITAMWWVSGRLGFVAEHPDTLEAVFLATNSGRMEALSFVAPFAYTLDWLILFSDKSKVLTLGIVSVFGVVAGSAVVAVATHSFHWEGFRDAEDTALHLIGAVLMGVGGVTAMGCTVGQGLSGISTLSLSSFPAVAAIIAGAVAALRWQVWRLDRAG